MYSVARNILVREFAKILRDSEGLDIGERKLFKWLQEKGYIHRDRVSNQWVRNSAVSNNFIKNKKIIVT